MSDGASVTINQVIEYKSCVTTADVLDLWQLPDSPSVLVHRRPHLLREGVSVGLGVGLSVNANNVLGARGPAERK